MRPPQEGQMPKLVEYISPIGPVVAKTMSDPSTRLSDGRTIKILRCVDITNEEFFGSSIEELKAKYFGEADDPSI